MTCTPRRLPPLVRPTLALLIALSTALVLVSTRQLAAQERLETQAGPMLLETVAGGLVHPWGMADLPEGGFLVTERPGRLRHVRADGAVSPPLAGVPEVADVGQGGLLDVALAPDFATSRMVYLTFAEARGGGAATSLARGRLNEGLTALEGTEILFRAEPAMSGGRHFGSRVVPAPDGETLFVTLGDRGQDTSAQDLSSHHGTVVRLTRDGAPAPGNPFLDREGARPEIFSYGHRNPQGAALDPASGRLFTAEMGPRGGDEINAPSAGVNYGWPIVSNGSQYSGIPIPDHETDTSLEPPLWGWVPSFSPSGMAFYDGDLIPAWQGDLVVGALSGQALARLDVEDGRIVSEEIIPVGRRIRAVTQGPDGALYLLVDDDRGALLRLSPADQG
ncbi:PQQ-dependent sugar dehydrogenase [Salinarimonas ramus]|uniref:Dehydrogenase n=1 Tax=Salinarimonas ramus TaxID=690164 RepID=A0A917QGM7_9HYPH|nr:PQQ-dependent sugar dehydrogenase [Salinarimonas ramus]GGK50370.1 dehydrogenase [Salinarimonas ramus]